MALRATVFSRRMHPASVRDAHLGFTGTRRTDVWLMLADNAYSTGTDAEYQAAVFDTYPQLLRRSVLWPTRGNTPFLVTSFGHLDRRGHAEATLNVPAAVLPRA